MGPQNATPPQTRVTEPFRTGAPVYAEAGWHGIIPLDGKLPALKGITGWDGRLTAPDEYLGWTDEYAGKNIGLRTPHGHIGLDVDDYGDKQGGRTVDGLESKLGPLPEKPPTSTSRDDGVSGIRMFRVPPGLVFKGEAGPDVEIAQFHHRLVTCAPSVHPKTGARYRWDNCEGTVPRPDEVPALPAAWVEYLTKGSQSGGKKTGDNATVADFIAEHTDETHGFLLRPVLESFTTAQGSRHDTMLKAVGWAAREAAAGFYSAATAFDALEDAWNSATAGEGRSGEFTSMVGYAVADVSEDDVQEAVQRQAEHDKAAVFDTDTPAGSGSAVGCLPEEFWTARPELTHIRQAARASVAGPDLVFYAVLARLSSMLPPSVRVDTKVRGAASMNIGIAAVGASGIGKSTGAKLASKILPTPSWLTPQGSQTPYRDDCPVGSGEGLSEVFMGDVEEEVPSTGQKATKQEGKTRWVRKQVRHNAFFYMDEGGALAKMKDERSGSVLAEQLRTALTGGTLGQQNSTKERTRIIAEGTYSLAMLIGFQPATAEALIRDSETGTTQRFLWSLVDDPMRTYDCVEDPGVLPFDLESVLMPDDPFSGGTMPKAGNLTVEESITVRLHREAVAKIRREEQAEELDSHKPGTLAKVAGLLTILNGRTHVTEDDWSLAETVWDTSCAVRGALLSYLDGKAKADHEARTLVHVNREARAWEAKLAVEDAAADKAVVRVARKIANRVHELGSQTRRELRAYAGSRDKALLDDALVHAESQDWIAVGATDYAPGRARPA